MKKNYPFILSLILIASISLFGCKKTQEDYTSAAESAESFAQDQPLIFSSFDMIDEFMSSQNFMQKNGNPIVPSSAKINYIDTIFSDGNGIRLQIYFDDFNTPGGDNLIRYGGIEITSGNPFNSLPTIVTVHFQTPKYQFFSISNPSNGSVIRFSGIGLGSVGSIFHFYKNSETKYRFGYDFQASTSFMDSLDLNTMKGDYEIEQIGGFNTPERIDNEYKITGSGKGFSARSGKNYSTNIIEPLIKTPCSKIFTKGKLTLQNEGSDVKLEINFGDGTCDSKIEVKSGAFKKEITL